MSKARDLVVDAQPLKVLVCGGRNYADWETARRVLDLASPDIVVHGGARGADAMGARWARAHGVEERAYYAKWDMHGPAAGVIRNSQMLAAERRGLGLVIAFPGGRGTADMVRKARRAGVEVMEIGGDNGRETDGPGRPAVSRGQGAGRGTHRRLPG